MLAYKVCALDEEGRYRSSNYMYASEAQRNSPFLLEYRIGEKTTAEIGGILVFAEEKDAQTFIDDISYSYPWALVEGEAEEEVSLSIKRLMPSCMHHEILGVKYTHMLWTNFEQFNYDLLNGYIPIYQVSYSWPFGTKAFKSFTPLREITRIDL